MFCIIALFSKNTNMKKIFLFKQRKVIHPNVHHWRWDHCFIQKIKQNRSVLFIQINENLLEEMVFGLLFVNNGKTAKFIDERFPKNEEDTVFLPYCCWGLYIGWISCGIEGLTILSIGICNRWLTWWKVCRFGGGVGKREGDGQLLSIHRTKRSMNDEKDFSRDQWIPDQLHYLLNLYLYLLIVESVLIVEGEMMEESVPKDWNYSSNCSSSLTNSSNLLTNEDDTFFYSLFNSTLKQEEDSIRGKIADFTTTGHFTLFSMEHISSNSSSSSIFRRIFFEIFE